MKVKFLGTAAAEGWPALFCECDSCERAKKLGGKNIRTRPSCLIDSKYMVDFCADTYMHKLMYDLKLSQMEHLFVTHSHYDHFCPQEFEVRAPGFAHIKDKKLLRVYGNNAVGKRYDYIIGDLHIEDSVVFKRIEPFKYFEAGNAGVMPLLANHSSVEDCFMYIIEIDGRVLLYGHDSGYFGEQTWNEILKQRFDGVILDCTSGPSKQRDGHMGIITCGEIKDRLLGSHSADEQTKFVITHFSHNINMMHNQLEKMAEPYNFIVAYDGFEIEI